MIINFLLKLDDYCHFIAYALEQLLTLRLLNAKFILLCCE